MEYDIRPEQLNMADVSEEPVDWNKTDRLIHQFIVVNGMMTTQQVVDMIDTITTKQGASVGLNRLIDKGLIAKVRQGRYVICQLK